MSAQDRTRWDKFYRDTAQQAFPPPDPLLLDYTPPLAPDLEAPPRALDLAAGFGQNGLWLATQGYTVDIMDISRIALSRARSEMGMRNLRNVNLLQVDIDEIKLDPLTYDLICVFRYLKRSVIPVLKDALKPGGRIIYETFNLQYLDIVPAFNVDFLVQGDELKNMFERWQVLRHSHIDHVTQLVALKPRNHA